VVFEYRFPVGSVVAFDTHGIHQFSTAFPTMMLSDIHGIPRSHPSSFAAAHLHSIAPTYHAFLSFLRNIKSFYPHDGSWPKLVDISHRYRHSVHINSHISSTNPTIPSRKPESGQRLSRKPTFHRCRSQRHTMRCNNRFHMARDGRY